jgi:hypothetical protein
LEVGVQQGNFKILRLLTQVLILFLVEKWIPPRRSETAEIGPKIRRNCLCLRSCSIPIPYNYTLLQFYLTYLCSCWESFSKVQPVKLHALAKCD